MSEVQGNEALDQQKEYQGVIKEPEHESVPPGHTAETWAIQQERMKALEEEGDKPYHYEANGYSVDARKAEEGVRGDEDGIVYVVTGNGLDEKVYTNKREAEIFAETHAPHFAQQSATMPSA